MTDASVSSAPADRGALRAAAVLAAITLLGLGLAYALTGTAIGRVLFPDGARGSLIERDGHLVGSALLAQPFADARYFQPRPSSAGYDPMAAAGSNQARTHPALRTRLAETAAAIAARDRVTVAALPSDAITQSGSGLDPHLSPQAAQLQVARVAAARGLDIAVVDRLLSTQIQAPQLGVLGQPRVNVLQLNLALDALSRRAGTAAGAQ